jgi:hypothetical protein
MNNEHLKRSPVVPGSLINTDMNGLRAYRQARDKFLDDKRQFEQMKNDVSELKEMMSQILEKLNK